MPSDAESLGLAWLDGGGKRLTVPHPISQGHHTRTHSRHTTHQPHTAAGPRKMALTGRERGRVDDAALSDFSGLNNPFP